MCSVLENWNILCLFSCFLYWFMCLFCGIFSEFLCVWLRCYTDRFALFLVWSPCILALLGVVGFSFFIFFIDLCATLFLLRISCHRQTMCFVSRLASCSILVSLRKGKLKYCSPFFLYWFEFNLCLHLVCILFYIGFTGGCRYIVCHVIYILLICVFILLSIHSFW